MYCLVYFTFQHLISVIWSCKLHGYVVFYSDDEWTEGVLVVLVGYTLRGPVCPFCFLSLPSAFASIWCTVVLHYASSLAWGKKCIVLPLPLPREGQLNEYRPVNHYHQYDLQCPAWSWGRSTTNTEASDCKKKKVKSLLAPLRGLKKFNTITIQ